MDAVICASAANLSQQTQLTQNVATEGHPLPENSPPQRIAVVVHQPALSFFFVGRMVVTLGLRGSRTVVEWLASYRFAESLRIHHPEKMLNWNEIDSAHRKGAFRGRRFLKLSFR